MYENTGEATDVSENSVIIEDELDINGFLKLFIKEKAVLVKRTETIKSIDLDKLLDDLVAYEEVNIDDNIEKIFDLLFN